MASINLGSVFFTLGADTKRLQDATRQLKTISDEVDRLSRSRSDEAQVQARQLLRQEQLSRSYLRQAASMTHMMRTAGMSALQIDTLGTALDRVNKVLGDSKAKPQEVARAVAHMNDVFNRARQELRGFQDQQKRQDSTATLGRQVETLVQQSRNLGVYSLVGRGLDEEWRRFSDRVKEGSMNSAQFSAAQQGIKDSLARVKTELQGANEQLRVRNQIMAAERQMLSLRAMAARRGTNISAVETQFAALSAMGRDASIATTGVGAVNFANQLNAFKKAAAEAQIAARGMGAASEPVKKFADAFSAVRAGAVVAIGPLSRFGAIIGTFGSILDKGQLQIAAFAAGFLVTSFAAYRLGQAVISARMDMDRMIASLTVSTGSVVVAQAEFDKLAETSLKFGLDLRTTGENYARFTAAASAAGISMSQQKTIFNGTAAAATALRLRGDQVRLMFLALEQMLSKGKVATEELRRQFAEHIPGGMDIAAKAMGVTQQKLIEMIQAGQLLARDFLPRLGEQLSKTFGEQAQRSAQGLQASFANLSTSVFLFLDRFDKAVGVSEAVNNAVKAISAAFLWLSKNMEEIVRWSKALAIGFLAAFGPTIVASLGSLIANVGRLTSAMALLNTVTAGNILVRLGLLIAGLVAGLVLFSQAAESASKSVGSLTQEANLLAGSNKRLTLAVRESTEALRTQLVAQNTLLSNERRTARLSKEESEEAFKAREREFERRIANSADYQNALRRQAQLQAELRKYETMGDYGRQQLYARGPVIRGEIEQLDKLMIRIRANSRESLKLNPGQDAELVKRQKKYEELNKSVQEADKAIQRLDQYLLQDTVPADKIDTGKVSKRMAEFEKVADMIAKVRQFREEIQKMNEVNADFKDPEVLRTVSELLRKMTGPEAAAISKVLKENGFWTNNLKDSLVNLGKQYQDTKMSHDQLIKAMTEGKKVVEDLQKEWADWDAQIKAWEEGPSGEEKFKDLTAKAKYLQEVLTKLNNTKPFLRQEQIDELYARAAAEWDRKISTQRRFEQISETARSAAQDIVGGFRDAGNAIAEAFLKGEKSAIKFDDIVNQMLLRVYNKILNFVLFNPLEKWLSNILYSVLGGIVPGAQPASTGGGVSTGPVGALDIFGVGGAKGLSIVGGRIQAMAKGGILTHPTIIPLASGAAIARERGRDEAVVPLVRMANGDMGIQSAGGGRSNVYINIIGAPSQPSTERRQSSRGEEIDIIFDRQLSKTVKSRGEGFNAMLNTMRVRPALQR